MIEFDEFGLMKAITRSERNIAHRIIEEFMLAANESVASYLEQKGVPSLFRIHEKPDPKKVLDFETTAAAFGYSLGVGPVPVKKFSYTDERRPRRREGNRTRGGQRRQEIEIPEDIHITPRMYQKLTQRIAGKPEERILSYLMLRSLKQARYSEQNVGHFALATPTYTHFTSPIRRYPDLIVHRILKEVLRESAEAQDGTVQVGQGAPVASETATPWSKRSAGVSPVATRRSPETPWRKIQPGPSGADRPRPEGTEFVSPGRKSWVDKVPAAELRRDGTSLATIPPDSLHDIAEESSETERRAADAARELLDWKKLKFMQDRVGEDFEGLIISVTKFGFFVELTELFIEGLVPIGTLNDDRFIYHENTRQIVGQRTKRTFSLGDTVHVILDRIDRMEKKLQFALVDENPLQKPRSGRR